MNEKHTKQLDTGGSAYCVECSSAAKDWVSWPCSRKKLVKAAVETALYLRSMDESAELEEAYLEGYQDGKSGRIGSRRPRKGLKRLFWG